MSEVHVVKEVWRGERGILHSCRLECTCTWTSNWTSDPAALRIPRAVHLDDPRADITHEAVSIWTELHRVQDGGD